MLFELPEDFLLLLFDLLLELFFEPDFFLLSALLDLVLALFFELDFFVPPVSFDLTAVLFFDVDAAVFDLLSVDDAFFFAALLLPLPGLARQKALTFVPFLVV